MWISVIWLSVFEDSNVFTMIYPDIFDFCIYLPTWPHSLANCETGCLLFICRFISIDAPMLFWRWQLIASGYDVASAVYYILHINYIYNVFIVGNKFPQMFPRCLYLLFCLLSVYLCALIYWKKQRETARMWCTPAVLYPGTCMLSCKFSSHEKNSRRRSFLLTLPIWFLGISSTTTRPVGML